MRRVSLLPADVHTFFLISKDFRPLLNNQAGVRDALARYEQLFCHLTITGLGGTLLEPNVAPWQDVVPQLTDLVQFTGDPQRVSLRLDPIVHWREGEGVRSNLPLAPPILAAAARAGVRAVRISFATLYGKVLRRKGVRWYDPSEGERAEAVGALRELTQPLGLTLYSCSQQDVAAAGAERGSCIDGALFGALHPRALPCPGGKASGQRPQCGCSPSVDIGSYDMRCPNGCRYCYANPTAA